MALGNVHTAEFRFHRKHVSLWEVIYLQTKGYICVWKLLYGVIFLFFNLSLSPCERKLIVSHANN